MTLRVATWNIHHGAGEDDVFDLDRLTGAIMRLAPDLIGLQEVDRHFGDRSGNLDTLSLVSEALGLHSVYGPALVLEEGGGTAVYGNAVLSRWPVTGSEVVQLPGREGLETRSLLVSTVDTGDVAGQITFACTHLSYEEQEARTAQMSAAAAVLAQHHEPLILVGDLNTSPGTPELAPLLATFTDCWAAVGEGPGLTCPALRPEARIDFVLVGGGVVPVSAMVPETDASDHRPVVVDLQL
jgi:endonuclease/exonuclease/phosphatase family metal-dependent hydrolase